MGSIGRLCGVCALAWGLLFATVLTMIVAPVLYWVFYKRDASRKHASGAGA
jgi:hypothetical protein